MSTPRIYTGERVLEQMQSNLSSVLGPLLSNPLLRGRILKGVTLANGTLKIPHGLGRALQGWFLVRIIGAATVYDAMDVADADKFLTLVSNAVVACDVYVF